MKIKRCFLSFHLFQPNELFIYPLYVRPGTAITERESDDVCFQMYCAACDLLKDRGFLQTSMRRFIHHPSTDAEISCGDEVMLSCASSNGETIKCQSGSEWRQLLRLLVKSFQISCDIIRTICLQRKQVAISTFMTTKRNMKIKRCFLSFHLFQVRNQRNRGRKRTISSFMWVTIHIVYISW